MQLSRLSQASFNALIEGAQQLEADSHGPKVYRLQDGSFFKLFRRKRLLSSVIWNPYSKRFCDNALRLKEQGIPTLVPLARYQLENPVLSAVHYSPLPGETLRQLSASAGFDWEATLPDLIALIRQLHRSGIYFRSLHLGNIVRTPDGRLGLIDVSDMRFLDGPLSKPMRRRNLAHFAGYLQREGLTGSFPLDRLEQVLLDHK